MVEQIGKSFTIKPTDIKDTELANFVVDGISKQTGREREGGTDWMIIPEEVSQRLVNDSQINRIIRYRGKVYLYEFYCLYWSISLKMNILIILAFLA